MHTNGLPESSGICVEELTTATTDLCLRSSFKRYRPPGLGVTYMTKRNHFSLAPWSPKKDWRELVDWMNLFGDFTTYLGYYIRDNKFSGLFT